MTACKGNEHGNGNEYGIGRSCGSGNGSSIGHSCGSGYGHGVGYGSVHGSVHGSGSGVHGSGSGHGSGAEGEAACSLPEDRKKWRRLKALTEKALGPERMAHSLAVADEAVIMGRVFGGDLVKLALAGLLHDSAKELGNRRLLAIAEARGLITDPAERETPSLLHGPVGAWLAFRKRGIEDPVILEAIRLHTTGGPDMSMEAAIVFMADLTEPGREYGGVDILRRLCREDLKAAMLEAIDQTLVYLDERKMPLHKGMLRCLAWLNKERGIAWTAKN